MKKLFLLVFIVSVVGVATAEVIDSVSFNPSRLGRYEHLKVADKLDAGSVLTSQFVTVNASRQTTMNYGGTLPVTVTNAEVETLDMDDDTTLFTPSVHLIGGDTTVTGTTNVGTNVKDDSNAASVYATQLNLPNHTINVHGEGSLWNGENHISDKSFVLGGNNIPSPATSDCKSLGWFTRRDDITNRNFKVLGCTPYEPPASTGCDYSIGCSSGYEYFYDSFPTDTCNGDWRDKYTGCTQADVAQGVCKDYWYVQYETPTLSGTWIPSRGSESTGTAYLTPPLNGLCMSYPSVSSTTCPGDLLFLLERRVSGVYLSLPDATESCRTAYNLGMGETIDSLEKTCSIQLYVTNTGYSGTCANGPATGFGGGILYDITLRCNTDILGERTKYGYRQMSFKEK